MVISESTTPARPNGKTLPDLVLPCQKPADGTWNLYAKAGNTYKRVSDDVVIECARQLVDFDFRMNASRVVDMAQVIKFLTLHIGARNREVFAVMLLTGDRRFIAYEELFEGTPTTTSVETRGVLESVFRSRASAIILAHNHAQGGCTPSTADIDVTYKLFRTLSTVGVELVDHLIIGEQVFSFANRNCLNECWLRAHAYS
jgi:DNA repair protein RadC